MLPQEFLIGRQLMGLNITILWAEWLVSQLIISRYLQVRTYSWLVNFSNFQNNSCDSFQSLPNSENLCWTPWLNFSILNTNSFPFLARNRESQRTYGCNPERAMQIESPKQYAAFANVYQFWAGIYFIFLLQGCFDSTAEEDAQLEDLCIWSSEEQAWAAWFWCNNFFRTTKTRNISKEWWINH